MCLVHENVRDVENLYSAMLTQSGLFIIKAIDLTIWLFACYSDSISEIQLGNCLTHWMTTQQQNQSKKKPWKQGIICGGMTNEVTCPSILFYIFRSSCCWSVFRSCVYCHSNSRSTWKQPPWWEEFSQRVRSLCLLLALGPIHRTLCFWK